MRVVGTDRKVKCWGNSYHNNLGQNVADNTLVSYSSAVYLKELDANSNEVDSTGNYNVSTNYFGNTWCLTKYDSGDTNLIVGGLTTTTQQAMCIVPILISRPPSIQEILVVDIFMTFHLVRKHFLLDKRISNLL